jgi:hypothetical protein
MVIFSVVVFGVVWCGWKVRGSKPNGGEFLHNRTDRTLGQQSLLYNGYRVFLPGIKQPERGIDHPPPSSAEVKED